MYAKRMNLGVTMGDAAGVGPELCLHALASIKKQADYRPWVIGDAALLKRVAAEAGLPFEAEIVSTEALKANEELTGDHGVVVDVPGLPFSDVVPGIVQASCGEAAARYIECAVTATMQGKLHAVVTAPVNKDALKQGGIPYPGHTEMLAALTGCQRFCMMMASEILNVCLATTHVRLSQVPCLLSVERLVDVITMAVDAMRCRGVCSPRVTVCGLNPHAGENGLFGNEESRILVPAILKVRELGINASDPLPPDTAFVERVRRETDVYIAMYHDQGLIPFKMLAFDSGVNLTLGLPLVRASVDHGTAFDLAWKGTVSAGSMMSALTMAASLARAKNEI